MALFRAAHLRAAVARRLEAGDARGSFVELASLLWGAMARLETPLRWPAGARVVAIGGATLGGSGKTPLAIACAEALADAGARVALVGHAYRASPRRARFVSDADDVKAVGDEALVCARQLSERGVPVTVAPSREAALDLALLRADVAVLDGPCQTRPRRADLALLAVDAMEPWGARRCPPAGDLRAPREALLAAVDRVVAIADEGETVPLLEDAAGRPVDRAWAVSSGAVLDGRTIPWSELRRVRVGLWTAMARPRRVVTALRRRGVEPVEIRENADHGPARAIERRGEKIDLWICTAKCRSHLPENLRGIPVATLEYALRLEPPLKSTLARLDPGSGPP